MLLTPTLHTPTPNPNRSPQGSKGTMRRHRARRRQSCPPTSTGLVKFTRHPVGRITLRRGAIPWTVSVFIGTITALYCLSTAMQTEATAVRRSHPVDRDVPSGYTRRTHHPQRVLTTQRRPRADSYRRRVDDTEGGGGVDVDVDEEPEGEEENASDTGHDPEEEPEQVTNGYDRVYEPGDGEDFRERNATREGYLKEQEEKRAREAADAQNARPDELWEETSDFSEESTEAGIEIELTEEGDALSPGAQWCAPLEVTGLERCPLWSRDGILSRLLVAKTQMLRGVVKVLEDPKSCGKDGDPANPLLLVQQLAVDEADAAVGASNPVYTGFATDAGAWSAEVGGMNRWLARYHRDVLKQSRPVIVSVHGDDVCAFELEVSKKARIKYYDEVYPGASNVKYILKNEDFDVPLALMTVGWDPSGDPTHHRAGWDRDTSCARRLLDLSRIKTWFTSHTQKFCTFHPTFKYLPIGFGGYETRNGLPQSVYLENARRRLRILEECPKAMTGSFDLLFECNTLERWPREEIWIDMTANKDLGEPLPVNRCPLPANEMVEAASHGLFAVSPPGTGDDCFRHYEMMAEGNIALVPDAESMRTFMGGLPAIFMDRYAWGNLTCDILYEMAETVQQDLTEEPNAEGWRMAYEKLTHGYWRDYIRRETLVAGGSSPDDKYTERSVVPLDPRGWHTSREVGCHKLRAGTDLTAHKLMTGDEESSKRVCAAICSKESGGGGAGFFGITEDNRCWCGYDLPDTRALGEGVADHACNYTAIALGCADGGETEVDAQNALLTEEPHRQCLQQGEAWTNLYAFGPTEMTKDYVYHGCFPEHKRFMYHQETNLPYALTPTVCEAFCTSFRYSFFAIERGTWCRCGVMTRHAGSSLREPAWMNEDGGTPLSETDLPPPLNGGTPWPGAFVGDRNYQCTMRCVGDDAQICGGPRAWDLYRVSRPCVLSDDCEFFPEQPRVGLMMVNTVGLGALYAVSVFCLCITGIGFIVSRYRISWGIKVEHRRATGMSRLSL